MDFVDSWWRRRNDHLFSIYFRLKHIRIYALVKICPNETKCVSVQIYTNLIQYYLCLYNWYYCIYHYVNGMYKVFTILSFKIYSENDSINATIDETGTWRMLYSFHSRNFIHFAWCVSVQFRPASFIENITRIYY